MNKQGNIYPAWGRCFPEAKAAKAIWLYAGISPAPSGTTVCADRTPPEEYGGDMAPHMLRRDSMSSSYSRSHFLAIISFITIVALPASAQVDPGDAHIATISRSCLWNADQSTWKTLGLKRAQIVRLNELRLQYPAVVDGQWVADEEMNIAPVPDREDHVGVDPTLSTSVKGSAASTAPPAQSSVTNTAETAFRPTGLQYQLREVLTPAQLRRWAEECEY